MRALVFLMCGACSSSTGSQADGGTDGSMTDGFPSLDGAALPSLPMMTGSGPFAIPGRMENAIEVVLPSNRPSKPPLLLAFHGTGGEPIDAINDFDLVAKAASLGFVAIAPRAGYRNGIHPADVDHAMDEGGSSWNMWTPNPQQNDDLVYLRALIDAASTQWGADATRVYTLGFSNGAYFSYFSAASMPDRIAGFAENSGGWMSDACPTRTDANGSSLYLLGTMAPAGQDIPCATIFADGMFPQQCRITAGNKLRPPTGGRVPFGYVGHYSVDDTVSVVWSCLLAEGLGARAQTRIRASDTDGTTGHAAMPGFVDGAWAFFANRTSAQ